MNEILSSNAIVYVEMSKVKGFLINYVCNCGYKSKKFHSLSFTSQLTCKNCGVSLIDYK